MDQAPEEFVTFIQDCHSLIDEIKKLAGGRGDIKDFLDNIPPKFRPEKKGAKKRKKKKKQDAEEEEKRRKMNVLKVEKKVFPVGVKYHQISCNKSLAELRNSLDKYRNSSRREIETRTLFELQVDHSQIEVESLLDQDVIKILAQEFEKFLVESTEKVCSLSDSLIITKLFKSDKNSRSFSQDNDESLPVNTCLKANEDQLFGTLQVLGVSVKRKRIKWINQKNIDLASRIRTPPSSLKEYEPPPPPPPLLLMPHAIHIPNFTYTRLRDSRSFHSVDIRSLDHHLLRGEHLNLVCETVRRCDCLRVTNVLPWFTEMAKRRRRQTLSVKVPKLGEKTTGLEFIRSLMRNPLDAWLESVREK